ncbi:conidiation-specific protein con-10 [Phlyctochytrium arcticum]|nr:conidiation-specific protein con-10 [Phlyctochytrium arcticum]
MPSTGNQNPGNFANRSKEEVQAIAQKGAEARHNKSHEEESAIAQKAAATRKERDPDAFKKMGEKGGRSSGNTEAGDQDE